MLLALALLAAPVQAQAPSPPREAGDPVPKERTDAPPLQPYKIILVGNSTMAPHSGWASAFCARQVKSSVACLNVGRGGRSTRSYRAEGSWDIAMGEAKVPGYRETYVLIQFGHNDQSSRPERWTDMTSEFPANLTRMVAEVRAAGAIPVLLTPLTRREFKDGKLRNTLEPWSDEVRKVAAATGAALVDLNRASAAAVTRMGPETSLELAQEVAHARGARRRDSRHHIETTRRARGGGDAAHRSQSAARPSVAQVRLHPCRRYRREHLRQAGRARSRRGRAQPAQPVAALIR